MRTNGILMALSSLPSDAGIGDFYKSAFEFIDLLSEAGIKIWQLLPLNPVGYAASPYQSECGEALDPIYISLDYLKENGYIKSFKKYSDKSEKRVDFDKVREYKEKYFKEAFKKQKDTETKEFKKFLKDNPWCYEYALFHTLFLKNNYLDWNKWSEEEKYAAYNYKKFDDSAYKEDILYIEWLQYIAYKEFNLLKEYAHSKGIELMGDIPFYVGYNSSDCWANQDDFLLGNDDYPTYIAGVPPDYFSETGQRCYDILRIDHFRAFDTYYMIPSQYQDAKIGEWKNAPGDEFFSFLKDKKIGLPIVAEDLGDLFPSVLELRDKYELPGMNVLEFTLMDKDIEIIENQVLYTGTHDNETLLGWFDSLSEKDKEILDIVMRYKKMEGKDFLDKILNYAFSSVAKYVIIPTQDYLGLPSYYRMNTPGTCGAPDWQFKLENFDEFKKKVPYIKELVGKYKR